VDALGKAMLVIGASIAAVGAIVLLASRFGVSRLPGDIVVRRGNFRLYAPIGVMILVSVVLTIVLNLIARFRR
jgi:Protein of unknown function (DUF2905)